MVNISLVFVMPARSRTLPDEDFYHHNSGGDFAR